MKAGDLVRCPLCGARVRLVLDAFPSLSGGRRLILERHGTTDAYTPPCPRRTP